MANIKVFYRDHAAYEGRRIISRDRAWLEFVPKGDPPPSGYLLRVTALDADSDHVRQKAPRDISLDNFDVYGVYETTAG